jgi:DHA2 family methylenomycin A resistance protein-like MFS transporter
MTPPYDDDASAQTETSTGETEGVTELDRLDVAVIPGRPQGPTPWALVAICAAYFMVILDVTVVNVALPSLSYDLHATTTELEWVVDGYSLVFAALLLSTGALGDRRGSKGVFQAGVGLFTCASLACGLAPSTGVLVAARAAQGLGAALAVPASLALLQTAYSDQAARRRALGIWGGVAGIAAGAGPVVGGALVSGLGWRSIFFLNVPIGAGGLALAGRYLPSSSRRTHAADPAGQLAAIAALAGLTVAVIEAGHRGWGAPVVRWGFAVSLVAGCTFVAVERRVRSPMLPLELFSRSGFSGATAVGLLINLGFYGELFVMSLYLQQVHHLSAVLTGLALLPQMAMAVIGSTTSGRVMASTGPRAPMLAGLCLGGVGLLALAVVVSRQGAYGLLLVPFVAVGLGMSLTMPAATAAVMEAAPPERGGLASGTINAARQVGGVIGVALLGTLVASRAAFIPGMHAGLAIAAAAFFLGAAVTALTVQTKRSSRPTSR